MKIEELKKELETGNRIYRGSCHDCSKPVEVTATLRADGAIVIVGNGSVYKIKNGLKTRFFLKCKSCFKKKKTLTDFQECEVYSRAVGYLRPVQQYNKGKREEFKQRKLFKNTEGL
jgi:hypothetical protein